VAPFQVNHLDGKIIEEDGISLDTDHRSSGEYGQKAEHWPLGLFYHGDPFASRRFSEENILFPLLSAFKPLSLIVVAE
jgi:hypothetical protein